MIRSKDLNSEVEALEKVVSEVPATAELVVVLLAKAVKALCLIIKVLRDMRTNQTTDMEARGVKLIEVEGKKKEVKK